MDDGDECFDLDKLEYASDFRAPTGSLAQYPDLWRWPWCHSLFWRAPPGLTLGPMPDMVGR